MKRNGGSSKPRTRKRKRKTKHRKLRALGMATVFVFGFPIFCGLVLIIWLHDAITQLKKASDAVKLGLIGVMLFILAFVAGGFFISVWVFFGVALVAAIFLTAAIISEDLKEDC